mgnify:CR=1
MIRELGEEVGLKKNFKILPVAMSNIIYVPY